MRCLTQKDNQLMNTWLNSKVECLVNCTWQTSQWNGASSGGVDAAAKQDICMSLIFILAKRKKQSLGKVVLDLSMKSENTHCMLYFDNSFNSATLAEKLFDRGIYCLGTVRSDQKIWLLWKQIKIWKEVISILNMPITWLLWNGLIIVGWYMSWGLQ